MSSADVVQESNDQLLNSGTWSVNTSNNLALSANPQNRFTNLGYDLQPYIDINCVDSFRNRCIDAELVAICKPESE